MLTIDHGAADSWCKYQPLGNAAPKLGYFFINVPGLSRVIPNVTFRAKNVFYPLLFPYNALISVFGTAMTIHRDLLLKQ